MSYLDEALDGVRGRAQIGVTRRGYLDRQAGVLRHQCPYPDLRTARGCVTFARGFIKCWREGWDANLLQQLAEMCRAHGAGFIYKANGTVSLLRSGDGEMCWSSIKTCDTQCLEATVRTWLSEFEAEVYADGRVISPHGHAMRSGYSGLAGTEHGCVLMGTTRAWHFANGCNCKDVA